MLPGRPEYASNDQISHYYDINHAYVFDKHMFHSIHFNRGAAEVLTLAQLTLVHFTSSPEREKTPFLYFPANRQLGSVKIPALIWIAGGAMIDISKEIDQFKNVYYLLNTPPFAPKGIYGVAG